MSPIIGKLLSNPHTTGAGFAFVLLKAGTQIALMWFPNQEHNIKSTADVLEGVAGFYGLAMAGDAEKSKADLEKAKREVKTAIDTGDTSILSKTPPLTPVESTTTVKP